MIVTVTPNPAVDLTLTLDALHPGATHGIAPARRRAGGKGVNVARVLAQTGHDALALGLVGTDEADWFARDLPGVTARFTRCAEPTRSTYALVETGPGRTSQLNERGAARAPDEWADLYTAIAEAARRARCVTVSGSLPPGAAADAVARMLQSARPAPVIADLVGDALRAAAACGADVLKPNRDELATTVGTGDPVAGARMLQEAGAGLVVVSLGEDGLVAVPRTGAPVRGRLPRPLHGNATGAGDAAVAAIAGAIDDGLDLDADLPEIVRRAVAFSAAAVLAPLAGTIDESHTALYTDVIVD
ncbi:1-phosphofructokinase family hexose kinase [Microbacterium luticocti]|uniref:1-phosphofructokinase family hexose kinase n=1 Tax=Microbacterium luticocti TaxID=451764 RepID=UPI0004141EAD|nr:PfkB family carbohydrate kinase [Microbacterium luticocti]